MNINHTPLLASVSELQRNYRSLLSRLKKVGQPIFILRKNKLQAVLVDPAKFTELAKKAQAYEEKSAQEAIQVYQTEKKAKKLTKLTKWKSCLLMKIKTVHYSSRFKTHQLSGKFKGYWSFSIDYRLRILFEFINQETIGFIDIDTHSIYR